MYKNFFKRLLDFTLSLAGIIFISPVFVMLWLMLAIANKGAGAFFTQARPGRNEKIFKLIKFKTMTDEKVAQGKPLPDEQRFTKIGKLIRSTSLDELPQLINVLRGDMSLVGPRPLLVKYLPRYNRQQARRHEVRPGITGWAQVNGRNAISWEQKFKLDVYYVEHLSLALDVKILWMTFLKVIRREGINNSPGLTMSEFMG